MLQGYLVMAVQRRGMLKIRAVYGEATAGGVLFGNLVMHFLQPRAHSGG